MATDKPRIQAFLEPELYQVLTDWQQERGIPKNSEAINQILKEYFGVSSSSPAAAPQLSQEAIEKIVRDEVNTLFKNKMEEDAEFWVNRLSERVATVEKSLEKFVDCSHRQVDELKTDLGERLAACEDSLEVLLSEPGGTEPGNSLDEPRSPEPALFQENGQGLAQPIDSKAVEAFEDGKAEESEELSNSPSELNLSQLARHLKVSKSVVSRRKDKPDFKEWSRGKDPDGKFWRYDQGRQIFRGIAL